MLWLGEIAWIMSNDAVGTYLEQRVLRDAQGPARFQEVRDVFHLLERHPRLVHLPHRSRLDSVDQLSRVRKMG